MKIIVARSPNCLMNELIQLNVRNQSKRLGGKKVGKG